jgi:hypothetical protein
LFVADATVGMDRETLVTGGSVVATTVGLLVLLAGVGIKSYVLQGAGGAVVLAATFALSAYLAGLPDAEGAH